MKTIVLAIAVFASLSLSAWAQNIPLQGVRTGTILIDIPTPTQLGLTVVNTGGVSRDVTYISQESVVLAEGEVFQPLSGIPAPYLQYTSPRFDSGVGTQSFTSQEWLVTRNGVDSPVDRTADYIVGPATIRILARANHNSREENGPLQVVTDNRLEVPYVMGTFGTAAASPPATQNVSSQVAVIPNDPNGQFEVILESSVDLVTWNVANPGTFGGDTPRRFFRTRIVRRN